MSGEAVSEQAASINCLITSILRRLFSIDPEEDLPVAQLRVCAVLRHGPCSISCLSKELEITVSAITQMADRLERAGLVERVVGEEDRRVKSLKLTPAGEDMMQARSERRNHRIIEALEHLAPEQREQIIQSLKMLLDAAVSSSKDLCRNAVIEVEVDGSIGTAG